MIAAIEIILTLIIFFLTGIGASVMWNIVRLWLRGRW